MSQSSLPRTAHPPLKSRQAMGGRASAVRESGSIKFLDFTTYLEGEDGLRAPSRLHSVLVLGFRVKFENQKLFV